MRRFTDDQVLDLIKKNPCTLLPDNQVRTCPVRLSFPYLFEPQKAMEEGKEPKYAVTCLFYPGTDVSVLKTAAGKVALEKFGDRARSGSMKTPFRDQAEKAQFEGYAQTPGEAIFMTATGGNKPAVVEPVPLKDGKLGHRLITERARVYPGVLALVSVRFFAFEHKMNRGVAAGLQGVMLIGDMDPLGGSGPIDPDAHFGSAQLGDLTEVFDAAKSPADVF